MNKDEATLQHLIDMCEEVGWDKGIKSLEAITNNLEHKQAAMFAEPHMLKEAQKLSSVIAKQNIAIGNLKRIRKERELEGTNG